MLCLTRSRGQAIHIGNDILKLIDFGERIVVFELNGEPAAVDFNKMNDFGSFNISCRPSPIWPGQVSIAIDAPKDVHILRGELVGRSN